MIATLTNTSGLILNGLDVQTVGVFGPAQSNATGGNRVRPLPHPFNMNGQVAVAGTLVLPVHEADFRWKPIPAMPQEPRTEINVMIQAGQITVGFAAQTPRRDVEEVFLNAV